VLLDLQATSSMVE